MAESETSAAQTVQPNRQPLLLTLVLLVEVAIFAVALVWIAVINSQESTQKTLNVTQAKLAARQSGLVERVSADLSRIATLPADTAKNSAAAADINHQFEVLNATQHAFETGAKTPDFAGKDISVPPLTATGEQQSLQQIDRQIGDVRFALGAFSDPNQLPADAASIARDAQARLSGPRRSDR